MTPPTDSLYKFLAIFGLVSLLWGFSVPWQKAQELAAARLALAEEAANYEVQSEESKLQQALLEQELAQNKLDQAQYQVKTMEIIGDLTRHSNHLQAKKALLGLNEAALAETNQIKALALWGGGVLVLVGFGAWYFLLQRHLDAGVRE